MITNLLSMDWLSTYLLPTAVSLAVFYLLYKGLVRNDAHLQSRRFLMLGFVVFSLILPFLNIPLNVALFAGTSSVWTVFQNLILVSEQPVLLSEVAVTPEKTLQSASILSLVGWIYGIVVLFLVGRGFVGVLRLAALSRNGRSIPATDATVILSPNIPTAFSFFRWIFIPETWYDGRERNVVLRHEHVHVHQKHSWDLMLMELVCAVQFFNPFAWLLKREMRLNHEFLADRGALKNNEDSALYFDLLFQKIMGRQPALVHSFHYSPLKHRIMMQLSKPAKVLSHARYLAFIPVALTLVILFACQGNSKKDPDASTPHPTEHDEETFVVQQDGLVVVEYANSESERQKPNDNSDFLEEQGFNVVEEHPVYPGGEEARQKYLMNNMRYPAAAREKGIQGTVYVTFMIERDGRITNAKIARGIGGGCDEETLRVVQNMPNWIPGKNNGKAVRVQFMMPIKFTLTE